MDGIQHDRRSRPLVFVDDLDVPVLDDGDHRHLSKSLRVAVGDLVTLSDGQGKWRAARFDQTPEPIESIHSEPRPQRELGVAFAPVKGQKPEWVIQKLTELGIDRIVPIISDRSVVRWDSDRSAKQMDRWYRVAREASMQCRRVWLPSIQPVTTFRQFTSDNPTSVAADPGGAPVDGEVDLLLVGPEGGWSDNERQSVPLVSLPGEVLRAETASVVAGAMLVALRAGYRKSSD